MSDQLKKYQERKEQMIAYLKLKLEEQDWHGVQDAASDIRDIESEMKGYESACTGTIANEVGQLKLELNAFKEGMRLSPDSFEASSPR